MNMATIDDSQGSTRWGGAFSDVTNDDFLLVDDELLDDFSGLLDLDTSSVFNESKGYALDDSMKDFSASDFDIQEPYRSSFDLTKEIRESEPMKKNVREDRSRPPSPKRRRPIGQSMMDVSESPPSPSSKTSLEDLQLQYQRAMEQLALSMRRTEMTRSEIVSYRKAEDTKAQLETAQAYQLKNADPFLSGSRSTLTVGLEQSRQMLRSYMNSIPTAPF